VNPRTAFQPRSRGFSLVEVLVALVVCSVGLLGLAKMESLALSSTGVASTRSIAAIQAASLAAAMKSNGGYWASGLAPAVTTVSIATATTTPVDCQASAPGTCTPTQMATYDLQQWAVALKQQQQLQGFFATITCSTTAFPVTCTISLQWAENAVAANNSQNNMAALQNAGPAAATAPYTLYVQP
jgi:type IV pilus assembly protein PilV